MIETESNRRLMPICLVILTAIASGFALRWLQPILVPFVLALLLGIALAPVVQFLRRRLRVPRIPAVVLTLVLAGAVLVLVGLVISFSLRQLASSADQYQSQTQELLDGLADRLPLKEFGLTREQVISPLRERSTQWVSQVLVSVSGVLATMLSSGLIVVIFVCFLMFGGSGGGLPRGAKWDELGAKVKQYVVVKILLSASPGILTGVVLAVLGIRMAVLFGLLAFLLNFIPSLGSIVAVLLPVPVVLLSPDVSTARAILAFVLPGTVQMVIGNVIEPRMMGKRMRLHPIAILLGLMFWGALWGVIGMILAVPLLVVSQILFQEFDVTRPVAGLLAGRLGDADGPETP